MIFKNIDSILQIGFETLLVKNIVSKKMELRYVEVFFSWG